ncbi:hypothetical protein EJV47_12400 [Hymenobacter gummosus]|uniref:HTH HARE-type domain-containing protein n=1 Tax=Hymenobacter gummosus TaxID=1776032 RepID=A0A431U2K3_9BACT|nr:hypothetical protein [Hymenobacter gummosus]RTQ49612.1 hypothetical protein EJV47_12400 [Hymenobacter gummosus]
MNQRNQVIEVMRHNGGFATLQYLNQHTDVSKWATRTPFASIRRIVQTSSDFFKIRPGLWALSDMRELVLQYLQLQPQANEYQQAEFDHTYYQGLLAEIGQWRGLDTYVPAQDGNRPFLGQPLREVTTLSNLPAFSYPHVLRRAATVDVLWFNARQLPAAMFEVEHSTDFQNSFAKYLDLQDFRAQLCLVASSVKQREFADKLTRTAFEPLRPLVQFISYEQVAQWHSSESVRQNSVPSGF